MSIAEERRLRFVDNFNRAIGDKAGRPMKFMSDAQINNAVPEDVKLAAAAYLSKKVRKVPKGKAASKKKEDVGPTSAADILKLLGSGDSGVLKDTLKSSAGGFGGGGKEFKLDLKKFKSGTDAGGLSGLWHKIDEAVTNNPVTDAIQDNPGTRFAGNALVGVLDHISRPGYAVVSAFDRMSNDDVGNNPFKMAIAGFHGGWAGLAGKSRVGFGDLTDNAPVMAQYVDKIAKEHPDKVTPELKAMRDKLMADYNDKTGFEQWSHRLAGLGGDILTDPTTYATGGTATIAKEAAEQGGRAVGKQAAKEVLLTGADALKQQSTRIAKAAIDKFNIDDTVKLRKTPKGAYVRRSLTDHIGEHVSDQIDNMVYDMRKGGMIGGNANDYGTIAGVITEGAREAITEPVTRMASRYAADIKLGKRFSTAERNVMRAKNPLFGEWMDIAENLRRTTKLTDDEILGATNKQFAKHLEPHIEGIRGMVRTQLNDALLRVPTYEFMGKKMYFPQLGKVGKKIGIKAGKSGRLANAAKAWKYSSWFPGYTSHISQKLKSLNVEQYDNFKADLEYLLKDTTPDQRKNIHRAIQEGIELPGIDGDIQKTIKQHYDDIWQAEIDAGARSKITTPKADNYVYNVIGKGAPLHPKFDDEWRKLKKKQVQAHNNIDGFTSQDAIAQGLHPEEDVGKALLSRKAKSIRELSRVEFKKDLVQHYGIKSGMHPSQAVKAGMEKVDEVQFSELYKKAKLNPGEALYLDKDIEAVYKNYNELVKYGKNARMDAVALLFANANKVFKTANTIYWPGFHIRNAVSDIFMGALDGVGAHRYDQIFRGLTHKDTARLLVGGEKVPFRRVYDSYFKNAATAGFFDSEMKHAFDPRDLSTMKYMNSTLKGSAGKINSGLRNISQHREDIGRLVHYYHALDDEMTHQLKKGLPKDVAWKNAEEAALERVNKFKFDYNALTPKEQSMRRFGMPFYTYMRKSTPVLLENILMNPKHFSRIQRMQNSLAPSDEFKGASLPGWMQEMAYSELSSGKHIGFTDQLLPTRTLHETFSNPFIRANPILQGLSEYQTGKDAFSGKPVGKGISGVTDILKNKMRAVSTYRSFDSGTKPTIDKIAGFLGLPIVQVTPERQGQRLRELEDKVTQQSGAWNKKLKSMGLKVRAGKDGIELFLPKSPSADEIAHNVKPKYPVREKERIVGTYKTFKELESRFKD